ncbi:signal peptidase II [Microcella daejeonensis]|uniref:signal peptidase II n=1 Tax=Microcella daejeonensis TaxID=2994971 RepID=UPI00226DB6EE|nr:signal peptidase II [Microcella daejeonensis]WAB85127.1 signal peptidase II [Microcella daejeonensis]
MPAAERPDDSAVPATDAEAAPAARAEAAPAEAMRAEAAPTETGDARTSLANPAVRRRIRRVLPWTLLLAFGIILLDQATKFWAVTELEPGVGYPVIGDAIEWRLVYNPGAAFGIGGEYTWILTAVAAIAVVAIAVFVSRISSTRWAIAIGSLFGGAISHLGDRLFREPAFARGEIVDFIDYFGFFIGNVADIALVLGAIGVALLSVLAVSPTRPEPASAQPETTRAP